MLPLHGIRACEQLQKICEYEHSSNFCEQFEQRPNFSSTFFSNWLGPFHTPRVRGCNGHLSSDSELILFFSDLTNAIHETNVVNEKKRFPNNRAVFNLLTLQDWLKLAPFSSPSQRLNTETKPRNYISQVLFALSFDLFKESLHMYLLSFFRFWTLSIERFWFWSILNGVKLKTSNIVVIQCRCPTVANNERIKDANAAITLLEKWPEKNSGFERDSNPRPLRYRCNALPTEVSKPYERAVVFGFGPTGPLSCGFDSSVGRALHW